jgi:thioredoxin-dependent peroxiredoxin
MLTAGTPAPDFDAPDCRGQPVRLSALRGKQVVLFFFPRAFSPACTLEVRHFRDNHARIQGLDAELIGVSVDRPERQCQFAEAEQLTFTLVPDPERRISEAYGVVWPVLKVDRRATFLIDAQGIIEDVINHEVRVYRHLDDVLEQLLRRKRTVSPSP